MTPEERIAQPKPYYSQDGITIYNAPWEDVWASLGLRHEDVALVWADAPYGVSERTDRSSKGRGHQAGSQSWASRDWAPVAGDDRPFDPTLLLAFPRMVLWGANNYSSRLPDSGSWWWWDKRDGVTPNDNGDGELAWTNLGGPPRQFSHLWSGHLRASEVGHQHLHPTQKPVALSTWGFKRAKLHSGDLVFSPYLGSGPEARAALDMGLRLIGCEIVEAYCAAAVSRLRQRPLFAEGV